MNQPKYGVVFHNRIGACAPNERRFAFIFPISFLFRFVLTIVSFSFIKALIEAL